jgi:hypothetical protein
VSNLTELAQTHYFSTMFGDPDFKTYSLQLATFNARYGWQYGDFSAGESNLVFNEVYDLTEHLLSTYDNSGKTFILQNWEGDNALQQNASAQKVQSMIDWLNCRQDAISAAVADSSSSNVWVYGAAECNKVGQPNWSGPRCVTDVFPYLHMDLYSYSDWYTRYEEDLLLEDLHTIKRYAPDSAAFGHENVMLGEFGLNRTVNGEAGNLRSSQTEFEIGMDAGARFAFYWLVYDQYDTNVSHGLVLNAERAGLFGLPVDHTGRYFTQTQNYFKTNALTLDVFEDLANDFSECDDFSNLTVDTALKDQLDNDPARFVRSDGTQSGVLEYSFGRNVRRLAIMGYEEPGKNDQVWVYASKTGAAGSYTNIPLRKINNAVYAGNTYRRMLHKNINVIPPRYRYFKIIVNGDVQWSPQIGSVRFYYERPPIVQTIEFGGLVADLTNTNHQAQIGADELVQWNGVDSWGGSSGLNGTLNNTGTNVFISSPATGVRLITSAISSTHPAGTNTATSSAGVLGVKGGDNAKFDAANSEGWTFRFDHAVVLKQLILSAIQYDSESAEVTINGATRAFTRTDVNMSAAGWDASRYVYTFDPPIELADGADVLVAATAGQWGLEGVVVRTGALAKPYDLWADNQMLRGTEADWFSDLDGDGLDNMTEYALGGDPQTADAQAVLPRLGKTASEAFQGLEYSYRRRIGDPGLSCRVEQAGSLISNVWSTVTNIPAVSATDMNFETVVYSVTSDAPRQFFRLQIEAVSE